MRSPILLFVAAGILVTLAPSAARSQIPPVQDLEWGVTGTDPGEMDGPHGLAWDGGIYIFMTDQTNHRVQKFTVDGAFITSWGSNGTTDGRFRLPQGIAVGPDGHVYVADRDNNRVQKFTSSGAFVTKWGTLGSGPGQFERPHGVAVDDSNHVFVVDQGNDRVQVFSSTGAFIRQFGGTGSGAGQFNDPVGIGIRVATVLVSDAQNRNVQIFSTDGAYRGTIPVAGEPHGVAWGTGAWREDFLVADPAGHRILLYRWDGTLLQSVGTRGDGPGQFELPWGLATAGFGPEGRFFVADSQNDRIQRFVAVQGVEAPRLLDAWGAVGTGTGQFSTPLCAAVGPTGDVYVTDSENDRVQRFTADGGFLGGWGTFGTGPGQFRVSHGIAVGSGGSVYVVDQNNHRVQRFTSGGDYVSQWGTGGSQPGQFSNPSGIAADGSGDLYVSDTGNSRIQKFSQNGDFILAWGASGTASGLFRQPHGVAVGPAGHVYVADKENNRVQKFTSVGGFVAAWGSLGNGQGEFNRPTGVACDDSGYVYVVDSDNHRLQMFTADGQFLQQWGGQGTAAGQFDRPHGAAAAHGGQLYVVDSGNNRVQRFDLRNDAPVAVPDSACVTPGSSAVIPLLANDGDPEEDPIELFTTLTGGTAGTVAWLGGGSVRYTAPPAYRGPDTFEYVIADDLGGMDTTVVTVLVDGPPAATPDTLLVAEDTPAVLSVLANDVDPDGDPVRLVSLATAGILGEAVISPDSLTVRYTPPADYNGPDSFGYTVADDRCGSGTASVLITVTPVNDRPVAAADAAKTPRNTPVRIAVLGNDTDPEEDPLHVAVLLVGGCQGTPVTDPGDTTVTFTPLTDFLGNDLFSYVVSDGAGGLDTAAVTVKVNTAPVALNDSLDVIEDTPTLLDVLTNDGDPDGDAIRITGVAPLPAHGTATWTDTAVTYTPHPDYHGPDTFAYRIADARGDPDTAVVVLDVLPVNDPPTAADDDAVALEDGTVEIPVLANDSDIDGDALFVLSVDALGNRGDASISPGADAVIYTPRPDSCGVDSLRYTVGDGHGGEDQAIVRLVVGCLPDAPVARNDTLVVAKSATTSLPVLANDTDADHDPLWLAWVGPASHGDVGIAPSGTEVLYTPISGYLGPDTFSYTVTDVTGLQATATVFLGVGIPSSTLCSATIVACPAGDLLSRVTFVDVDGQPFIGMPVTVDLSDPALLDSLFVCFDTDTVLTATVDPMGHASFAIRKGGAAWGGVRVLADWGAGLRVLHASRPLAGTDITGDGIVDGADSTIVAPVFGVGGPYDARMDLTGDGFIGSGDAMLFTPHMTDRHSCPSAPPIPADDHVTTPEDHPVVVAVLANDTEPEGEPLHVARVLLDPDTRGQAAVSGGGATVTYTPPTDFNGADHFRYVAADPTRGEAEATVFVTVTPVNDAPVAVPDSACTPAETAIPLEVLANDGDIDGDALAVASIDLTGAIGAAAIDPGGTTITYTPAPAFSGRDALRYAADDGHGGLDTALVVVRVDAPPVARPDTVAVPEDGAATISVLANDTEPEGEPLHVASLVTTGTMGTVSILPGGSAVSYTTLPNWNGTDRFGYVVAGTGCADDSGTAVVIVTPMPDAPVARPDTLDLAEDGTGLVRPLANDTDVDDDPLSVLSIDTSGTVGTAAPTGIPGEYRYTPPPDFFGTTSFTYVAKDPGGLTASATVLIRVAGVNDRPVARPDFLTIEEDETVVIPVLTNDADVDGDALAIAGLILTYTLGHPVIQGTSVQYEPKDEFAGVDAFRYVASDGHGGLDTTFVQITVTGRNDAPQARDDVAGTLINDWVVVHPLRNDTDADGDSLWIASIDVSGTLLGDVYLDPDLVRVIYVPHPDTSGVDHFLYSVTDGNGSPDSARVDITITGPPDPAHSSTCLTLGPAGTAPMKATVRDAEGRPVGGARVEFDLTMLTAVDSLVFCDPASGTVFGAWTGLSGEASALVAGGGSSRNGAAVRAHLDDLGSGTVSVTLAASRAVAGFDFTRDLQVGLADLAEFNRRFQGPYSPDADYDCSGTVGAADLAAFNSHFREQCLAGTVGMEERIPARMTLGPAVPNPFDGATVVAFDLDRPCSVRIEVFDVAGRAVAALFRGELPAGRHRATWDGRDRTGAAAASGVYIVRLDAGGETRVTKLVLRR